ncbi:MAG: Fe-S cluster assembly protein SufD [Alphaproteobacteria bacterium]|nr:Fe-S cluster assembly protein SufD [Alphaproteobacteria bacterium]
MSAVIEFPAKPETRPYLGAFTENTNEPQWLRDARRRALSRFAEAGFPNRRSESWRYLDLRSLQEQPLLPSEKPFTGPLPESLDDLRLPGGSVYRIEIDGHGLAGRTRREALPAGLQLTRFTPDDPKQQEIVEDLVAKSNPDRPFLALGAAFFTRSYRLTIEPGTVIDKPIEIIHLASGEAEGSFHRLGLIELGAGSRATVIETYAGEGRYWRNDITAVNLAEGAALSRAVLVEEAAEAVHTAQLDVTLATNAYFDGFALLLNGRRVRHEVEVTFAGEGARCRFDGAYIVAANDEANIVTTIDHQMPGGETRELIKGVAADRGHGAFQGKIIVREQAQKTDAQQQSRNLMLGRRAVIDTKPELEIYADDVKCAHGATVGELDEASLFYLRARGIPDAEARRILIEGFLCEAVEEVADPAVREYLLRRLAARLARLEE